MGTDVIRLDLRLRRRGVLAYTIGMAFYVLLIVAIYPTFKSDTSFDALTKSNPTVAALFGATGSLTSPDGWLSANVYANFLPLFELLIAIGYGAAAIAGQDEDGTLGTLAAQPLSRAQMLLQKAAALAIFATPVPAVALACALAGPAFDLRVSSGALMGTTLGVWLLGLNFGALALLIGAWSGSRALALGLATALAAASYVVSSLAPAVAWIHHLRYISPFFWSVGNGQLVHGLSTASALLLVGVATGLIGAAAVAFQRFDLH